MPWYIFNNGRSTIPYQSVFYYPNIQYDTPLFVAILTFNLRNPERNQRGLVCLITEDAEDIYMSDRSIYVSYTDFYSQGEITTVIHKVYVRKTTIIPFANARVAG